MYILEHFCKQQFVLVEVLYDDSHDRDHVYFCRVYVIFPTSDQFGGEHYVYNY